MYNPYLVFHGPVETQICQILQILLDNLRDVLTRLVGVCSVLERGSCPRYTSASARLKGVGVRGASLLRAWCWRSGENLANFGVEWADMSAVVTAVELLLLRVGVVSREEWWCWLW